MPDVAAVAKVLRETARIEILPRYRQLAADDIREKSPGDLVTVADEAMELALSPRLLELLPNSLVLGEEAAAMDSTLMEVLAGGAPIWVLDPIDGTANFAAGKPEFVSMVALVCCDEILASWIYDPVADSTVIAIRNGGVWRDGTRISMSAAAVGRRGIVDVVGRGDASLAREVEPRRSRVEQVKSFGCAGLEYLHLASGALDFLAYADVMPWDHAPGAAILTELGGYISYIGGKGYQPSAAGMARGILAARNRDIWDDIHGRLFGLV